MSCTNMRIDDRMPDRIDGSFTIVDFDDENDAADESAAIVTCGGFDLLETDTFDVAGYRDGDHYHVEIAVTSESRVGLWRNGRILIDYDFASGHCQLQGFVGATPWVFQNVNAVIDRMIDGLMCLAYNEEVAEEYDFPLHKIACTLEKDRAFLTAKQSVICPENAVTAMMSEPR